MRRIKVKKNTPFDSLYLIDPVTGCWNWMGATKSGYAIYGHRSTRGHILSYERKYGKVPIGLELDHTCKVKYCVNPDHLEAVTHTENVRRRKYCIINLEIANKIREEYSSGTTKYKKLGLQYGLTIASIGYIINNQQWKREVLDASS